MSKRIAQALRRYGSSVSFVSKGRVVRDRAVINITSMSGRKRLEELGFKHIDRLGGAELQLWEMHAPFNPIFDGADIDRSPIHLVWRDKTFHVVAYSVIPFGDEPAYVWAMISPVHPAVDDFEPIDSKQKEGDDDDYIFP